MIRRVVRRRPIAHHAVAHVRALFSCTPTPTPASALVLGSKATVMSRTAVRMRCPWRDATFVIWGGWEHTHASDTHTHTHGSGNSMNGFGYSKCVMSPRRRRAPALDKRFPALVYHHTRTHASRGACMRTTSAHTAQTHTPTAPTTQRLIAQLTALSTRRRGRARTHYIRNSLVW